MGGGIKLVGCGSYCHITPTLHLPMIYHTRSFSLLQWKIPSQTEFDKPESELDFALNKTSSELHGTGWGKMCRGRESMNPTNKSFSPTCTNQWHEILLDEAFNHCKNEMFIVMKQNLQLQGPNVTQQIDSVPGIPDMLCGPKMQLLGNREEMGLRKRESTLSPEFRISSHCLF